MDYIISVTNKGSTIKELLSTHSDLDAAKILRNRVELLLNFNVGSFKARIENKTTRRIVATFNVELPS